MGATSRNVRAAASAAASREGFTSVAAIEREVSIARMTVASRPGSESFARGLATPTMSAASATRAMANGSSLRILRGAGSDAATSAGVPNRAPWRLAPALADDEQHHERGHDEQAEQRDRACRSSPAPSQVSGEDAQPVATRREDDVRRTCGREIESDLPALLDGGLGEPGAQARIAGIDAEARARLRVAEPDLAHVDELVLARVADLDREHVVAGGEVDERRAPVTRPAEVGDDGDERPLAGDSGRAS